MINKKLNRQNERKRIKGDAGKGKEEKGKRGLETGNCRKNLESLGMQERESNTFNLITLHPAPPSLSLSLLTVRTSSHLLAADRNK